jgi:hypothetical protein
VDVRKILVTCALLEILLSIAAQDAGETETVIAAHEEHGTIQPIRATWAPRQIIEENLAGCTMGLIPGQRVAKIHTHKIIKDRPKTAVLHKVTDTKDPAILVATTTMATGTSFQTNTNSRHSQAHFFRRSRHHQHKSWFIKIQINTPEWPEGCRAARVLVLRVDSQIKVHKDRQIGPPMVRQSTAIKHLFRQLFRMLKNIAYSRR